MSIVPLLSFIVICDVCGEDGGSSRPTREEAEDYGGLWQNDSDPTKHTCDECQLGGPR